MRLQRMSKNLYKMTYRGREYVNITMKQVIALLLVNDGPT